MARGASSTGKGVRRAAPDRQARVGVQDRRDIVGGLSDL